MDEMTKKKIEQRAYELFVKRGGVHGYHFEDWLRAEREITALSSLRMTPAETPSAAPVAQVKKKSPAKTVAAKKTAAKKPVAKKPSKASKTTKA
jgi:hypothetical protein